jgi:hypothetical protein
MSRIIARLPEAINELCLLRMGIQARRASAWFFAHRLKTQVNAAAHRALIEGAGLLCTESFRIAVNHHGFLQYWRSFDELEAWSRNPPHTQWWRSAVERMRLKNDLGVYHETFLVRGADIESIYMNCQPAGLATFGVLAEPKGPLTTGRGRLGRGRS